MKRIVLLGLVATQLHAMELINSHGISAKDEALKLYHNNHDVYIEDENAAYRIEKHQMNKELRDVLKYKALAKFIENEGYIRINEDDGKYSLAAKVRGDGAGPWTAWFVYNFTKGTIYASAGIAAGAAIGTAVAASGGGVAAAAIGAGAGKTISVGVSAASGLGTAASIGTAAAGGAVVNAVGATTVATAAGGLAASTGSAMGVIAAVEGASIFAGALFAGPWCP